MMRTWDWVSPCKGSPHWERIPAPEPHPDAGFGYYSFPMKIALAYESQLVEEIPLLPHDVRMDKVITEKAVYNSADPPR